MNIVAIKEFSQEACDAASRLLRQLSSKPSELTESSFRAIVEAEHTHLLFLYADDGEVAGMLTIGVYRTPSGSKAWIEDVVVDDRYRGYGYGKALVAYSIDFLRGMAFDTVSLTSNPSRVAANGLYQALGFSLYETNVYRIKINHFFVH